MTQEEILLYNKRCAEFLGYVNTTPTDKDFDIYHNDKGIVIDNKVHTMIEPMSAKFHSDWNWIMEVVEAIEKTNRLNDNEYYPYCVTIWKNGCVISDGNNGYKIVNLFASSKKEAVLQAINKFLIWYENNK